MFDMFDSVAFTCRDHLHTEYLHQEPLQRLRGEIKCCAHHLKQEQHLALPKQTDYFQIGSCRRERSLRLFVSSPPCGCMLGQVGSLSNEEREKLTRLQSKMIGEANRISGITPNAMVILYCEGVARGAGCPCWRYGRGGWWRCVACNCTWALFIVLYVS